MVWKTGQADTTLARNVRGAGWHRRRRPLDRAKGGVVEHRHGRDARAHRHHALGTAGFESRCGASSPSPSSQGFALIESSLLRLFLLGRRLFLGQPCEHWTYRFVPVLLCHMGREIFA